MPSSGESETRPTLSPEEIHLIEELTAGLKVSEEIRLVRKRFKSLEALGKAISLYPSIVETQYCPGGLRDGGDLAASLSAFASSSHLLHLPARVTAFRSWMATKYQAFSFLSQISEGKGETPLRRVLLSVIGALMVEEVYFACLEDPDFPAEARQNIAWDLINLWEKGQDPRSPQHLSALESLWKARDATPPSFGTMEGNSELIRITMDMEGNWASFIVEQISIDGTRWALEEFLFGLSWEEILSIRERLRNLGLRAVNPEEIRPLLGRRPAYGIVNGRDFRSLYDFYVDRREAAAFRRRISIPGPTRTLEEIYLKYCIAREQR